VPGSATTADGWTELCITDPDGQRLIVADPQGPLGDLGLADLFWESREPENAEYSIADLEADFPEASTRWAGSTSRATLCSAQACSPMTSRPRRRSPRRPAWTDDAETASDLVLGPEEIVVEWEPVTETIDGRPVSVTAYEVIVTDNAFEDPHGFAQPIYDVHVRPDTTSLSVPAEFFAPDTVYEIEVLVLEESGNQTISLGFFTTA
jgi:hypothetical protein